MPTSVPSTSYRLGRHTAHALKKDNKTSQAKGPLPCDPFPTLDSLTQAIDQDLPNCDISGDQVSGISYILLKNAGQGPIVIDNYAKLDSEGSTEATLTPGAFDDLQAKLVDQALALEGHCVLLTHRPSSDEDENQAGDSGDNDDELYFQIQLLGGRHVLVLIDDTDLNPLALRTAIAAIGLISKFATSAPQDLRPLLDQYDYMEDSNDQISDLFTELSEIMTELFEGVLELFEDEENLNPAGLKVLMNVINKQYEKAVQEMQDVLDDFEVSLSPASDSDPEEGDEDNEGSDSDSDSDEPVAGTRQRHEHDQDDLVTQVQHRGGQFICETCHKPFETQRGLNIHKGMMHRNPADYEPVSRQARDPSPVVATTGDFKCDVAACSKGFATLHGLKVHKGMMHKGSQSSSGRSQDYAPSQPDALPHKCNQCPKGFASAHGLAVHKGMMHKGPSGPRSTDSNRVEGSRSNAHHGMVMHACNMCTKEFETAHGLAIHKGKMHQGGNGGGSGTSGRQQPQPSSGGARCDICNRVFKNARGVAVHKGRAHK